MTITWEEQTNVDKAQALLGLLNYYHRFIPAFADLMHTIQKLLKRNVKFEWIEDCDKACRIATEMLAQDPILYYPDPNKPWIIETDASKTAFAGILLLPYKKHEIVQEIPVTFISYNFTGTQQSWSTTEHELYAIFMSVRKWTESIHLEEKAEVYIVQTDVRTAEQENIIPKPPEPQYKVQDIF